MKARRLAAAVATLLLLGVAGACNNKDNGGVIEGNDTVNTLPAVTTTSPAP